MKVSAIGADNNFAFKNYAPFTWCVTHINDAHIDTTENLDIIVPMYNLIEYSDNYSGTSERLWQFIRDELPTNNNKNLINVATINSSSFKYELIILGKVTTAIVIIDY